jgi:prepilin-type N-terminal cleavage/methylation domain-containing protein
MKNRKNKKGFTIVELVIVIGVIGILSAILIPTFVNLTNKANQAREQEEVRNAYVAYSIDAQDGILYNEITEDQNKWVKPVTVLGIDKVAVKRDSNFFTYSATNKQWEDKGKEEKSNYSAVGTHTAEFAYNGCYIFSLNANA